MEVKGSEAQGRRREAGSEGSVEQKREPMNEKRIRGLRRGTSWHMTTKSISIKSAGGKSDGCAWKEVELTSGDLPFVVESRLRMERSILTGRQKSASGVVASIACESRQERRPERSSARRVKGEASKQRNS